MGDYLTICKHNHFRKTQFSAVCLEKDVLIPYILQMQKQNCISVSEDLYQQVPVGHNM